MNVDHGRDIQWGSGVRIRDEDGGKRHILVSKGDVSGSGARWRVPVEGTLTPSHAAHIRVVWGALNAMGLSRQPRCGRSDDIGTRFSSFDRGGKEGCWRVFVLSEILLHNRGFTSTRGGRAASRLGMDQFPHLGSLVVLECRGFVGQLACLQSSRSFVCLYVFSSCNRLVVLSASLIVSPTREMFFSATWGNVGSAHTVSPPVFSLSLFFGDGAPPWKGGRWGPASPPSWPTARSGRGHDEVCSSMRQSLTIPDMIRRYEGVMMATREEHRRLSVAEGSVWTP
ncbi:DNA-binding response regulator [Sesbania bispinosa]|nr:DNA-binding response regulator [Sesbania bispinosa]